jgi:hypothetical protein
VVSLPYGSLRKILCFNYTYHYHERVILMILFINDNSKCVFIVFKCFSVVYVDWEICLFLSRQRNIFSTFTQFIFMNIKYFKPTIKIHFVIYSTALANMHNTCYIRLVFVRNEDICYRHYCIRKFENDKFGCKIIPTK